MSRIRRHLHEWPMGLLMDDVHYMDILAEERAEPVRVHLIAWMEMSSLFTWITPVFLSKGIRYALGRMPKARSYLENGHLELDTDVTEQPYVRLFCGLSGFSRQASTILA